MWKLKIDIKDVYGNAEFQFASVLEAAKFIDEVMAHTCNEMEFHLWKVKEVPEGLALQAEEGKVE